MRIIHSTTPETPGTSMYLQQADPWLAYQRGRSYYFHEWGSEDGAFNWLPVRPTAASTTSCGMCHNLPFPSVGSGGNVAALMGVGRNAPHFFGAGLMETLGIQIRAEIMAAYDTNHNGYIDVPEESRGRRAIIEAAPGVKVDFGSLEDLDGDGRPDLNPALFVAMVDAKGDRFVANDKGAASRLSDPGVVGYDLIAAPFASSAGDHQFPSLRLFAVGVLNNIMGILADMRGVSAAPLRGIRVNTWGKYTNSGALQTHVYLSSDPAEVRNADRKGTISEGELDMLEWYLTNHPAPARGPQDARTARGRTLMVELGCTSCHVADWVIKPADEKTGLPGDRRFFDLAVAHNPATNRLEGHLTNLTKEVPGPNGTLLHIPRREGFFIHDIYTDLRHHDLGEQFWEYNYSDKLRATKRFKTPALWGVGSTAPYGHDGQSPTLDDVIRRHGGEAEESAKRYIAASQADRKAVVAFLESLVLYQPDSLPTDLNGDGKIEANYKVHGLDMGPERFRPEVMFQVSPHYRGWTNGPDGDHFFSYELLNVADAYGEKLPALLDANGDGIPDILQQNQTARGAGEANDKTVPAAKSKSVGRR
ncbi:MAG TPA: di-heme oxidoredictase family protein [Thermoanaerobaculia bacterium]|nr:di-heme oxidoredictase family protein [Thermoanaerobaculia bacterium]